MGLVHKSVEIRPEVWRKLRINAELSGVPVRDFITYLIEQSQPIPENDQHLYPLLLNAKEANRRAARA